MTLLIVLNAVIINIVNVTPIKINTIVIFYC
jgi:hypothetical protein